MTPPWYIVVLFVALLAAFVAGYARVAIQLHRAKPAVSRQISEAFAAEHERQKVSPR